MLFKNIAILDENLDYLPDQWVAVKGESIAYIGGEKPQNAEEYGEVYNGAGKLMMSALYNAHAHAPMTCRESSA